MTVLSDKLIIYCWTILTVIRENCMSYETIERLRSTSFVCLFGVQYIPVSNENKTSNIIVI